MIEEIKGILSTQVKSQQYISSSYMIVKELLENSLDANASRVKVIIDDGITVEDNGSGIEDLDSVCRSGYTSKDTTTLRVLGMNDEKIETLGFRGQALSSISLMSDVEIITATKGGLGKYKNYCNNSEKLMAREKGTTVRVSNVFKNCPIRRETDTRNQKRNVALIIGLLRNYCYIYELQTELIFNNKSIFVDGGSGNIKQHSVKKHGNEFLEADDDLFYFLLFPTCTEKRQVMVWNKRVVNNTRLCKMITTRFRSYFDYSPTFVLSLKDEGDVNISVDKTEIILKDQKQIECKIKSEMDLYFSQKMFLAGLDTPPAISSQVEGCENDSLDLKNEEIEREDTIELENIIVHNKPELDNRSNIVNTSNTSNIIDAVDTSNIVDTANISNCQNDTPGFTSTYINEKPADNSEDVGNQTFTFSSAYAYLNRTQNCHLPVVIEKRDFKNFNIIGQFNQGFILCTLLKDGKTLLITVDQHAADEIYNFEGLRKTFCLKKQPLLVPIDIALTPIQELLIQDNLNAIEKNGFEISQGKLTCVPVYKNKFFTKDDFYSLIENISNSIYESNKFTEIMASKACRTSVMIGSFIGAKEMRRIVDNLALLDLPWNCPHGRPTFKILCELKNA